MRIHTDKQTKRLNHAKPKVHKECKHKWNIEYRFLNPQTDEVEEIWERCKHCGTGRILMVDLNKLNREV